MRDLTSFAVFFALVIGTALSKPLWSTLIGNDHIYPTPGINAHPQYLAAYQDTHSPYYFYNIYTNVGDVPSTIHVSGKPEVSHVPGYNFYYGTPIYDFRFPLSPIYPVLTPSHPGDPPILPPTQPPFEEDDYDGIEKLDATDDPDKETKQPDNSEQSDDSITVEAL